MKVSVFGIGYVGAVSATCLANDGHKVIAVDVDAHKVNTLNRGRAPIVEAGLEPLLAKNVASGALCATTDCEAAIAATDISFICVGTPSDKSGAVGLDYVRRVCHDVGAALATKGAYHCVVVRSTIVPGTLESVCIPVLEEASSLRAGKEFGVGYYPEFLREGSAIEDFYNPGLVVFGAIDKTTEDKLRDLCNNLPCTCHVVPLATAELVKYASNAWRAVKITFANEIGNIAKACGIDGQVVMQVLCSDDKVSMSPYFLRPGFAFGGSCLPKDLRALRHVAREKSTVTPLLDAVLEANIGQIARAETMVENSGCKSVGLVGISFKVGTDDTRESPLAELAARLISKGFDVRVYDPSVSFAYGRDLRKSGPVNGTVPDLQARLVTGIDELIACSDVILVGNRYEETVEPLSAAASSKRLVDLTRLKPNLRSGGHYQGICW
ncbi:MAG: nucleotide sugar dehydrogenase [Phyllobacterium sp.]|uniref:nucleotide sugar dehydrogenase n=1 Tax=Phyllobacterium sp. TaxID=1871046 RepID=UPI0030F24EB3